MTETVTITETETVVVVNETTTQVVINETAAQVIIVNEAGPAGPPTFAEWGEIVGTLSDQTDLQAALDLKLDAADFDPSDFDPAGAADAAEADAIAAAALDATTKADAAEAAAALDATTKADAAEATAIAAAAADATTKADAAEAAAIAAAAADATTKANAAQAAAIAAAATDATTKANAAQAAAIAAAALDATTKADAAEADAIAAAATDATTKANAAEANAIAAAATDATTKANAAQAAAIAAAATDATTKANAAQAAAIAAAATDATTKANAAQAAAIAAAATDATTKANAAQAAAIAAAATDATTKADAAEADAIAAAATDATTKADAAEADAIAAAATDATTKANAAQAAAIAASTPIAHVGSGGTAHANVVAGGAAGFMTGTDKTKLDAISGTNTGDQTTIAGITGTMAQFDAACTDGNFAYADAAQTFSLTQTFTLAPVFTDQSGSRTALGLGTAATQNTGTSGTTIPFLDGTNVWSGVNRFNSGIGINTASVGAYGLRNAKNISGSTTAFGIAYDGDVASDVTSAGYAFNSTLGTAVASFTLSALVHYRAFQNTIGAGSTVTVQTGFNVTSSLTGATTNYGFRGQIAAGTNRYNLYMDGTADNHMAGSLGIGTASLTGYNLRVQKNVTGATTAHNVNSAPAFQSDVTVSGNCYATAPTVQAATFTLATMSHYLALQSTFGAGSTVTSHIGFYANATLLGGTTNYGYYGELPAITTGGGTTTRSITNVEVASNVVTVTTSAAHGFVVGQRVTVAATTNTGINGSGLVIASTPLTTTFTYARTMSNIASVADTGTVIPAKNYNLYCTGTAPNYLAGDLGIGTVPAEGYTIRVQKNVTGLTGGFGVSVASTFQSDVTSTGVVFNSSAATQAASFTLTALYHFRAQQGTIGASSTVTTQYGFAVDSTLTGATTNYGFRGGIPSGSNRWNLYMDGTASNYLEGALGVGSTSLTGYNLRISRSLTGATTAYGSSSESTVQSDVTVAAYGYRTSLGTQAASFTLTLLSHFIAQQATVGAGSTVTAQAGFTAASTLTGATSNYGFRGQIASGSNRWNLYMDGTADNFLGGLLQLGATDTSINRAAANGLIFGNGTTATTTSRTEVNKSVTGIANNSATAVLTVTVPNGAHSGQLYIELCGSLGAGGAIGANEASATNCYTVTFTRTTGVNAVAGISAASGASSAAVAGAATVTCTAAMSAVSGAVGASNTFTVNVTIARSGGSSTNHTCLVYAKLMNANATGITIA